MPPAHARSGRIQCQTAVGRQERLMAAFDLTNEGKRPVPVHQMAELAAGLAVTSVRWWMIRALRTARGGALRRRQGSQR